VATRRLLTFVLLLEPLGDIATEGKAYRVLKRRLKILGKLRDAQIQRMEIAAGRERFPGLEPVMQRLARREQRLMELVLGRIRNFKTRKLQRNLEVMKRDLESFSGDQNDLLTRVRQSAQEAFDEVLKRRMAIDASDAETIHRTRVAFKKFRYIVEGMSPAFTGLTRSGLLPLSDFQTSMGKIQDLEITENWLLEFLEEHPEEAAPLRSYLSYLRRQKLALQRAFVRSADRLFEFWPIRRLDSLVSGRPPEPIIRFAVHESGSVKFLGTSKDSSASASNQGSPG
jgi:CHAD domain-containing protein